MIYNDSLIDSIDSSTKISIVHHLLLHNLEFLGLNKDIKIFNETTKQIQQNNQPVNNQKNFYLL